MIGPRMKLSTTPSRTLSAIALGATSLLIGCGGPFREGAQHAHFLPNEKIEVHTALQFDMLPEPVHAEACAEPNTAYTVTVLGSEKALTRGEKAAALQALNSLNGKADVLYLTRSYGSRDGNDKSCGEVWGRALRLRSHDAVPAGRPGSDGAAAAAESPGGPTGAPPTAASPADKTKMGF